METKSSARIAMLTSGTLMGFVGLFVTAFSFIPTFAIVSLRGLFGCLILLVTLFSLRKFFVLKEVLHTLPLLTLLQGLTSSATIIFYFYCIQTAGYGYAAFMLYTGPIFAVIFMRIFLQRIPTKRDIIAFIIAISGIAVLTQPWTMNYSQIQGNTVLFGFLMGILSGLCSGFNSTIKVALFAQARSEKKGLQIKELLQKYPIEFNLSLATVATAFMFLIFVIPSASSFTLLTPTYWGLALLMGLLPTAIAFSLFNYGLQFDQAGDVLIFSYVESVVAGILTAVISLNLTWPLVLGGGLIIFANVIMALKKKTLK